VPFQAFEASDGWFIVGCPKEKFWQRLTEVLERPDLAADPRYRSMADRLTHRTELLETREPLFRTRSVGEWLRDLQAAGIPSGPINDVPTALAQDRARDLIVPTHHPEFGTVRQLATAVRVGANTATATRAPALGEDRDQVLRELLRYDEARIGQLDSEGAFG
jgi:crotonobetainyl-CoA:carnitine CoA-transferase CaiB-like acyl-CoA transferase